MGNPGAAPSAIRSGLAWKMGRELDGRDENDKDDMGRDNHWGIRIIISLEKEFCLGILFSVLCASIFLLFHSALAFDLVGHRGARGLAPENTLPAFAAALSIGVTALELDTAITKDGVIVISHDQGLNPNITRDKTGRWLESPGPLIKSLTFNELQEYDVGRLKPNTKYAQTFAEQKAVDGARIPRLADLFALIKKANNHQVRMKVEIKVSPIRPEETLSPETSVNMVVELIRKEGMEGRVSIMSFDWRVLRAVQKNAPEIPTVFLSLQQPSSDTIGEYKMEGSPWTAGFQYKDYGSVPKMVKAARGKIWSPYYRDLTKDKLKEAHDLGMKVIVWTVNEPASIKKMLDFEVDGIISDRPDVVRQAMAERGMALPAKTPVQP
jgi:glycerophosphoryl diester phosphodiesterase